MGAYKYIKENWGKNRILQRDRLTKWRSEPATVKVDHPTRLDRAHALGYKAKQGVFIVRQRIERGGRMRPKFRKGRKPKNMRRRLVLDMNYQSVAEQRAVKKYPNCEVLNSYFVGKDGINYWFEVIMVDRMHPAVLKDKNLMEIAKQKRRVFRGRTSSERKSRGLRRKGFGAEKVR